MAPRWSAIGVLVLGGCGSFGADATRDADAGMTEAGAATDGAATEAGSIDGGTADDCPGTAGPKGVRVGAYCIDSTEVTRGSACAT